MRSAAQRWPLSSEPTLDERYLRAGVKEALLSYSSRPGSRWVSPTSSRTQAGAGVRPAQPVATLRRSLVITEVTCRRQAARRCLRWRHQEGVKLSVTPRLGATRQHVAPRDARRPQGAGRETPATAGRTLERLVGRDFSSNKSDVVCETSRAPHRGGGWQTTRWRGAIGVIVGKAEKPRRRPHTMITSVNLNPHLGGFVAPIDHEERDHRQDAQGNRAICGRRHIASPRPGNEGEIDQRFDRLGRPAAPISVAPGTRNRNAVGGSQRSTCQSVFGIT